MQRNHMSGVKTEYSVHEQISNGIIDSIDFDYVDSLFWGSFNTALSRLTAGIAYKFSYLQEDIIELMLYVSFVNCHITSLTGKRAEEFESFVNSPAICPQISRIVQKTMCGVLKKGMSNLLSLKGTTVLNDCEVEEALEKILLHSLNHAADHIIAVIYTQGLKRNMFHIFGIDYYFNSRVNCLIS